MSDALSDTLLELYGADSVSLVLTEGGMCRLSVLFSRFSKLKIEQALQLLSVRYGIRDWRIKSLEKQNWQLGWSQSLQEQEILPNVWVIPYSQGQPNTLSPFTFDHQSCPTVKLLKIDASDAFGDGSHITTRICLQLLDQVLMQYQSLNHLSFADIGAGTGILSLWAYTKGITCLHALDIDVGSLKRLSKNWLLNDFNPDSIRLYQGDLADFSADCSFDLVAANLPISVLQENFGKLVSLLRPLGQLVVSGLSQSWMHEICAGFLHHPVSLGQEICLEGWYGAVFQKNLVTIQ